MGLTQAEFAKKLGTSFSGVQTWERGTHEIKESSLRLIESTFNVNPAWLREGRGDIFAGPSTVTQIVQYRFFPDVYAAAGNGYINTDENYELMSLNNRLADKIGRPQYVEMIQVYGDSMEPKYRSNDWLFVDKRHTNFTKEGIYVILNEGVLMVKYLQKIPKGMRIHSLNAEYADVDYLFDEMKEDEIKIIGLVTGAFTFN